MTKNLLKAHRRAHNLRRNALGVFGRVAQDLRRAADVHVAVGNEATTKINELSELRYSADSAAADALRQAEAIEALVK